MITRNEFFRISSRVAELGFIADAVWADSCRRPETAEDLAREAIFVICNSGMKNTIAQKIFDRVMSHVFEGGSAHDKFGHRGKCAAIDLIWDERATWFAKLAAVHAEDLEGMLALCESMPWIGSITKFHLAKNWGAQVAKPDVHLKRLADREGCTAQQLCERLSVETGEKVATVDVILWRACAIGVIDSRSGEIRTTSDAAPS